MFGSRVKATPVPRVVPDVPEDHRNDVDCGAEVIGDLVVPPVVDGALRIPRIEHRDDSQAKLLLNVLGKLASRPLANLRLELVDDPLPRIGIHVGVERKGRRRFGVFDNAIEDRTLDPEDDVREHRNEATVGIPRESFVPRRRREGRNGFIVEAKVEDRVHHTGHREARATAHGNEQRILRSAERLSGAALDLTDRALDLRVETVRHLSSESLIFETDLGRDGEARWHRKAGSRHLRKARSLASQQVAHLAAALFKEVQMLGCGSVARGLRGRGQLRHEGVEIGELTVRSWKILSIYRRYRKGATSTGRSPPHGPWSHRHHL